MCENKSIKTNIMKKKEYLWLVWIFVGILVARTKNLMA